MWNNQGGFMATSSLKKSFVIDSKKEVNAFVKLFINSIKNPPKPVNRVNVSSISNEQMARIINVKLGRKN